jgi:hypothetical protein
MEPSLILKLEDITPCGVLTLFIAESRLNNLSDIDAAIHATTRLHEFMTATGQYIKPAVDPKTNKNILRFAKAKKLWRLFR